MPEIINTEPNLFTGSKEDFAGDREALARVNRLLSFNQSIGRRPTIYLQAFLELGEEATAETLDLHDPAIETRSATSDPKKRIKEFFAKRDDKEIQLDEESALAIFNSEEFRVLTKISQEKTAISIKTGAMKSEKRVNPEAREASNAVRRYILGTFIGRMATYDTQQASKKVMQAG